MYDEMGLHRQDITAHQRPQDPASTVPCGTALCEPEWPWGILLLLLDQSRPSPLNLEAGKGRESAEVGMRRVWPSGKSGKVSRVHRAASLQGGRQAIGRLQATLAEPSSSVITEHVRLTWQAQLLLFS